MRTIAIVAGGYSPESEVSVRSANEVANALASKYIVYIITISKNSWYWEDQKGRYHNIDKNDFTLVTDEYRIRFDAVFIAIHGTPGEDGLLQGYFDLIGIPYTGCDTFCSALTFNKSATKHFLRTCRISMANSVQVKKDAPIDLENIIKKTGLPCFVKPNNSGSSFGVTKVKNKKELLPAIEKAFKESSEVMIETFMAGREVTCGVVKTRNKSIVLPVTEIISKNEFFDYEAKYTPEKSDEITPADIQESITKEVQRLSSRIYDLLGCKGMVRVDFIVIDKKPFFIEINTVPGMSAESIIPKQFKEAGFSQEEICSLIIEDLFDEQDHTDQK